MAFPANLEPNQVVSDAEDGKEGEDLLNSVCRYTALLFDPENTMFFRNLHEEGVNLYEAAEICDSECTNAGMNLDAGEDGLPYIEEFPLWFRGLTSFPGSGEGLMFENDFCAPEDRKAAKTQMQNAKESSDICSQWSTTLSDGVNLRNGYPRRR